MTRFPFLHQRYSFHKTPPHELKPAFLIGYEFLRFAVCVAFIASLFWIYSLVLARGGV